MHGISPTPHRLLDVAAAEPGGRGEELLAILAGRASGRQASAMGGPGGLLEGDDRALYDSIRAWRGGAARAARKRPFMVVTEAVMQAVARARPANEHELRSIKGLGPKKVEAYGHQLLELVRAADAVL